MINKIAPKGLIVLKQSVKAVFYSTSLGNRYYMEPDSYCKVT